MEEKNLRDDVKLEKIGLIYCLQPANIKKGSSILLLWRKVLSIIVKKVLHASNFDINMNRLGKFK